MESTDSNTDVESLEDGKFGDVDLNAKLKAKTVLVQQLKHIRAGCKKKKLQQINIGSRIMSRFRVVQDNGQVSFRRYIKKWGAYHKLVYC